MLSGLNGSGKSSIFDAVTYGLFGHHRGGGRDAVELINKDSDGLVVEFDYLLDGRLYRAKRTAKRDAKGGAKGTQQMSRFDFDSSKWVPIEGTGQKREFDAWVADNVGLTYETFTSSVLLLQGQAEKLLSSKPEDRRKVLASIVDLERYERLFEKADEDRKKLKNRLDSLSDRLAALPPVDQAQFAGVEDRIQTGEQARERTRGEVERLLGLEARAREWVELQGRLAQARRRRDQAEGLLADAAGIEKAVERLRELREALPHLEVIANQRREIHQSEEKGKELEKQKQKQREQLAQRDNALQQTRDKRQATQALIEADETRRRSVTADFRRSSELLVKLKEHERHEADLARVREDLKRLPDDPAAAVARAREACDALSALTQTLPLLTRFAAARDDLRRAQEREREARLARESVEARGKQYKSELDKLKPLLDEAVQALQKEAARETEAKTLLKQARESLKELTELTGAKVCRHCGQSLTPGHLAEEKRRRAEAATEADGRVQQAVKSHQAARAAEQQTRARHDEVEKERQELRVEYSGLKEKRERAEADVTRLQGECGRTYAELPEPFRTRIAPAVPADWPATAYPAPGDLGAVRAEADGLATARQGLRDAERVQEQWQKLKTQEASKVQDISRLQTGLPTDRDAVRREHARLETEEKSLEKGLTAKRAELKETDAEVDRLTKQREETQSNLNKLDAELKNQELVQQHARQASTKAAKALSPSWQATAEKVGTRELFEWTAERDRLIQERTDERGRELHQARVNRDVLREDLAKLDEQAEAFPAEARRNPADLAADLTAARQVDRTSEKELNEARAQRALLESYLRQREEIAEAFVKTEGDLAVQRTLAELLGKDRLQLYLVRQAERQVVEHANAVLDRLSGGQLCLELSGSAGGEGSAAKALDLVAYNRLTGEKPINVAFLSGSQKFRVAVSLALGIGQYASRQHRPIESVIIDEGFGCLDRQGRQVMIQELQNLRGQMRCILLVSHQEEFADAFSDGYHFELDGGATRVKRFQK
jgi:DNA repair exonuclease SbcCD ATPase subunit